jgi:PST family polysaccharide transporter
MFHFGGILTLNNVIAYIALNSDKVMIGRFFGADAIGIYARAFQVISIPTDNLNWAVGEVAFSALSRLQHDSVRLKSYFLKGFSLLLGLTLPVSIVCALFADDVVLVVLGPKWQAAAEIVRLLAPSTAVFAIINPLTWLICSLGLVRRTLRITVVHAPILILGCLLGLHWGVVGVAFAYSTVMVLWVVPHIAWCVSGTGISFSDVGIAALRPLICGLVAGAVGYAAQMACAHFPSPFLRLVLETGALAVTFYAALVFAAGQKALYVDLLRAFSGGKQVQDTAEIGRK